LRYSDDTQAAIFDEETFSENTVYTIEQYAEREDFKYWKLNESSTIVLPYFKDVPFNPIGEKTSKFILSKNIGKEKYSKIMEITVAACQDYCTS
jgi:hypothetical protein